MASRPQRPSLTNYMLLPSQPGHVSKQPHVPQCRAPSQTKQKIGLQPSEWLSVNSEKSAHAQGLPGGKGRGRRSEVSAAGPLCSFPQTWAAGGVLLQPKATWPVGFFPLPRRISCLSGAPPCAFAPELFSKLHPSLCSWREVCVQVYVCTCRCFCMCLYVHLWHL